MFKGMEHISNEIRDLCFRVNHTPPSEDKSDLYRQIFSSIGENTIIRTPLYLDSRNISIGNNCMINYNFTCLGFSPVVIEDNVGISSGVTLIAIDHPKNPLLGQWIDEPGPITIKRGAWIGANVTILSNVTIGENATIGAGSVITKDIPDGATAYGNPAKVKEDNKSQLDERYTAPTLFRG